MPAIHRFAATPDGIVEAALCRVSITDVGLSRGYGVFDFFRVRNARPLFFDKHLQRLHSGLEALGLIADLKRIEGQVAQVIERNALQHGCIRILVTGGESADGFSTGQTNWFVTAHDKPAYANSWYDHGISVALYEHRREMPRVKSTNYLTGLWLQKQLAGRGYDDVIYHENEVVTETPRSNIFIVDKGGQVCTPGEGMLDGVTRSRVMELTAVEERNISPEQLMHAEEVFLTSTTKGILPITAVEGYRISDGKPGPVTLRLMAALQQQEDELFS